MSTEAVNNADLEWEFGDRVRKVRRNLARMNQIEMAYALGVSQKVYATWESGRSKPGDIVKIAKRIEELWGPRVTAAWMLGVKETSPRPPYEGTSRSEGAAGGSLNHADSRDDQPSDLVTAA